MADISPALPAEWPGFDDVRGTERGDNEQRILRFQISAAPDHHTLYRDKLMPALAREGAELIGLSNTLVGVSTANRKSIKASNCVGFPILRVGKDAGSTG
ncbi:MAG: hypothetical protein QGH07_14650 [Alphaproteobacteria bacterium]|jgi:hypothetical protein|nr:hypothetical protein [Alphaproteobacteria bacterium]